ncbi:MAG: carboxypeptidase-like regulatory domain-containing protein [Candidatus Methanoperedens sp.]|nr:carboxypeptidase-like regulatory domain-containing protein [Candidatus Methanoperedens sp.]MCZ7370627.1 carboxypeptidase-like regulatory domain-containing protein [Candidatus Methanoperedens sp.]
MGNVKRSGKILILRSNLLLILIILGMIAAASGGLPSHINPSNVTVSNSNLLAQQLSIINELLLYRSEIFISLNKGNIKDAKENFDEYLRLLRENDNILVQIDGDVYGELKGSAGSLNLSTEDVNRLRALYDEGKAAYENNQTDKAIQIAISAREVIGNLSSLQQAQIMDAVARFPGVNITRYETGLSTFNNTIKEIQKRWRPVELTLFDDTVTKLSVAPPGGEFGDTISITGNLTLPRNGSGVPDATMAVKLDNETFTSLTTDKKGKYNYTFKIPGAKPGNHTVYAEFVPYDEPLLSSAAKSTFFIQPSVTGITIDAKPEYGEFGDILRLRGNLTAKNASRVAEASIMISIDNGTIVNVKTDNNGTYRYDFKISMIRGGKHTVRADFNSSDPLLLGATNMTTINVIAADTMLSVNSNANYLVFGDFLSISGNLLTRNASGISDADIVISIDNQTFTNVKTDEDGSYKYNFTVPNIKNGVHRIGSDFIPSAQPLIRSGNATEIEVMQTNTTLSIAGPKMVYQNDYLNITGNLLTSKNRRVPASNISVQFDSREIGTAIVNNGNFSFSYWMAKNVSLGNHLIMIRFNGESSLLPSENSMPVEIKTNPVFYKNIIFLMLALAVLSGILYLGKEKVRIPQIEALVSSIRARFGKSEKIEEPSIATEPVKEEIEQEEPRAKVQQEEILAHLDNLIRQRWYRESISISFKSAKDCISAVSGIKVTQQQTPREFYDLVKKSALEYANEFKELTEVYELAMYSSNKMNEDMALKTLDLLKKIYKISKNE